MTDTLERRLLLLAVALGLALRTYQYVAGTSLWLDELALTNGILGGTLSGLFDGPSDFSQVAPPAFLVVEWLLHRVAPTSDLLLRLWPFLMGGGALILVALLAREVVGIRYAWIPTLLVALSGPLIFTSAQVKPYSSDVFCTCAILLAATRADLLRTASARRWLTVVGALVPFFALGAVFAVAAVAAVIGFRGVLYGDGSARRSALGTLAAWGTAILLAVWLSSRLADPGAAGRWAAFEGAFPAFPPRTLADLLWPAKRVLAALSTLMGLKQVSVFVVLLVAGWVALVRQKSTMAWYIALSLVAAFAAAALQKYPFGGRVSQWVVPLFALLFGAAVQLLAGWLGRRERWAGLALGAAACLTPAMSLREQPPPYAPDDVKPAIAHLATSAEPGDAVYVYWGAWHGWTRYRALVPSHVLEVIGGCPLDYPRGHLRELERVKGNRRLWVLIGRVHDPDGRAAMLAYLDSIGVQRERFIPGRAAPDPTALVELFRYELGDATRLANVSADAMALPAGDSYPVTSCVGPYFMWRRTNGTMAVPVF